MATPFLGEIRVFGGNFAIKGFAFCNGQSLSISQNQALYSLLGTTYGGDGVNTFNLPNLQSRLPIHFGTDTVGNVYTLGENIGVESVTLTANQLGSHTHLYEASSGAATAVGPGGGYAATGTVDFYTADAQNPAVFASNAVGAAGSSAPHTNIMPCQCVNFLIALEGIFPARS